VYKVVVSGSQNGNPGPIVKKAFSIPIPKNDVAPIKPEDGGRNRYGPQVLLEITVATVTVIRVVHSSVLIDFDGSKVLTDPWFSERFGYYHGEPYGVTLENLPHLAGVVVSHGHYDHYDMQAFRAYPDKQVPLAVKRGIAKTALKAGFTNVIEMDAWETTNFGPVTITATPGKHGVPEITYLLQAGGATVYFGGDTLLIPELSEIGKRFRQVDVALLAINGLRIRPAGNRKVVMDAKDAAELCRILQPRYAVPIHYSFTGGAIMDTLILKYAGSPSALTQEFQQATASLSPNTSVRVLAPGEPLVIQVDERVRGAGTGN
jgi:L-ascorbate metabolism protein UlaG (beta-lactamase superfamily)